MNLSPFFLCPVVLACYVNLKTKTLCPNNMCLMFDLEDLSSSYAYEAN